MWRNAGFPLRWGKRLVRHVGACLGAACRDILFPVKANMVQKDTKMVQRSQKKIRQPNGGTQVAEQFGL